MMAVRMATRSNQDEPLTTREILTRVYLEQYRDLLGLAALILRDRYLAEEVVQDAYLKLMDAGALRDHSRAGSYMRSVVLNLARSKLRRRLLRPRLTQPAAAPLLPEEAAVLNEEHRDVIAAIAALPARQRECVVLRHYAGLSDEEIAKVLQIAPGSVKRHIHRAMKTLVGRMVIDR